MNTDQEQNQEQNPSAAPVTYDAAYAERSGSAAGSAKDMLNHLASTTPELEEQQRQVARVLIEIGELLATQAQANNRNVPAQAAESVFRLVIDHLTATRDAVKVLDDTLQLYANMYGESGLAEMEALMHRVSAEGVKLSSGLTAHFIRVVDKDTGTSAMMNWLKGHDAIRALWGDAIGANPDGAKLMEYMTVYGKRHKTITRLVSVVDVLDAVVSRDESKAIPEPLRTQMMEVVQLHRENKGTVEQVVAALEALLPNLKEAPMHVMMAVVTAMRRGGVELPTDDESLDDEPSDAEASPGAQVADAASGASSDTPADPAEPADPATPPTQP